MVCREKLIESELKLRDMQARDLKQVVSLERNAQISPWSLLSFEESLANDNICRVVEVTGADDRANEIVAFHVCSAVLDELHIMDIVADPTLQGLGLGHKLMQDILELALAKQRKRIFLEVRRSNLIAQALYQKWQFKPLSVRKNYYRIPGNDSGQREDALVLVRELR